MILKLISATIGKKQLVGLTGLALAGFVFTHMLGNLLIFVDAKAYNLYSHALTSNPLIYVAEVGLLAFVLGHILFATLVTLRNKCARPQKYAVSASGEKSTSFATKTMIHQGAIMAVFIVLHLITFKYGTHYDANYDGLVVRDIHALVIEVFKQPGYVVWYVICLLLLGFHLSHGVSSSLQTLGFNHPAYTPTIKKVGIIFAGIVCGGFISQPIYVYFLINN